MIGKNKISKTLNIEGMSCIHCAKKVETALKQIKQVKSAKEEIEDSVLKDTIEDLGYKVV